MVSSISPNVLQVFVPPRRFAHVVGVLAAGGGIVDVFTVVILDDAVDAVPHALVELDSLGVAFPDEEINEPGIRLVGSSFQFLGEDGTDARATCLGSDGKSGDMGVPGQIVLGILKIVGRTLHFAHNYGWTKAVLG